MASRNLEQGVQAIQQQQYEQGKRLIKIALRNDDLTPYDRVQAYVWLAEADTNPIYKIEQYQQALQIDGNNADVINRLNYWQQVAQNQQQQFQQGMTPSQGMPPVNPNQQQFQQGMTPSQGMQPVNPNQQPQNFPQQGQTDWWQQGNNNPIQQGLTPSQGMQPINPNQMNPNPGIGGGQTSGRMQPVQQSPIQVSRGQTQQDPPIQLYNVQRTVGIYDAPNGNGTGFFVTQDGLVATTRHIVGGARTVTVELLDNRRLEGDVVRTYPEYDLALIQTNVQVQQLLNVPETSMIPDNTPLVAVTHAGGGLRSAKRRSAHNSGSYWIPTLINRLEDAGGNPIFDGQSVLVGMLTQNASRTNQYFYGLHIHQIYQCVREYKQQDAQLKDKNTYYCNACGIISQAPAYGGHFCEHCGGVHPYALEMKRFPQPDLAGLYGENQQRPCPNCQSQVGFYQNICQRCGYEL